MQTGDEILIDHYKLKLSNNGNLALISVNFWGIFAPVFEGKKDLDTAISNLNKALTLNIILELEEI